MQKLFLVGVFLLLVGSVAYGQDSTGVGQESVIVQTVSGTPQEVCDAITPANDPETREYEQAEQVIDSGVDYRAIFCTSAGAVYVDLLEDAAPITVNNFVFLASNGYYNNTIFHRVIEDFMAQGGDPTATGSGGPGYQFEDEFVGYLTFEEPGWLAMANAGPGTNGSQFFITTAPTTHLNFAHTIFGEVLVGQDNVENIQLRDPAAGGDATALDTVVIVSEESDVNVETADSELFTAEQALESFVNLQQLLQTDGIGIEIPEAPLNAEAVAERLGSEAIADALAEYGHAYSLFSEVSNEACDLENFPFVNLSYSLHAFEEVDQADSFIESDVLGSYALENGYTYDEELELYTRETEGCETSLIEGLTIFPRGQFVGVATSSIVTDAPYTVDLVVEQVALLAHENILGELLRSGIR